MITYILCSVIETILVKTTCFAITQTFHLGMNCGSYLISHLFHKNKRNRKLIYMEDIVIQDVKMMDTRSKYIDYNDSDYESDNDSDSDSDYVYEKKPLPSRLEMPHPNPQIELLNESTLAYTMHDKQSSYMRSDDIRSSDIRSGDKQSSYMRSDLQSMQSGDIHSSDIHSSDIHSGDNDETSLDKQVQIIKEIINEEKYLNNDKENEIKKKEELEEYLKNEYDKRVKEEIDNEWVSIQILE